MKHKAHNIIFLDIDGVLNSFPYDQSTSGSEEFQEIRDFHTRKLAKIYHECNAKIVLSSTWRTLGEDIATRPMYNYLVNELSKYDMVIFDKTPIYSMNRPKEISKWLNVNQSEVCNYAILDDDFPPAAYAKYGLEHNLVQTRYFCDSIDKGGLQEEHVKKTIAILKGGQS